MQCAVYGMEDFPLEKLEVVEGEIDVEKLKTGRYILEGLPCDDSGRPLPEASHYSIGDKAVLHNYRGESDVRSENRLTDYEFEVMAKVKVETYTNSCGIGFNYNFYLPAETYKEMVSHPAVMNYVPFHNLQFFQGEILHPINGALHRSILGRCLRVYIPASFQDGVTSCGYELRMQCKPGRRGGDGGVLKKLYGKRSAGNELYFKG